MEILFREIEEAAVSGASLVSLIAVFAAAEACAAIHRPDLKRNGKRFAAWYDAWVKHDFPDPYVKFGGDEAWWIRNGLVHEFKFPHDPKRGYDGIRFMPPKRSGPWMFHFMIVHVPDQDGCLGTYAYLTIDAAKYCLEVLAGCRAWLASVADDAKKQASLNQLISYRAFGGPFADPGGLPVISSAYSIKDPRT